MVRMYAAELGIDLTLEEVDLMAGENRQAAFLSKTLRPIACLRVRRRHNHRGDNHNLRILGRHHRG